MDTTTERTTPERRDAELFAATIARQTLAIPSLTIRGRDALDFYEVHVDCVREALERAYLEGFRAGAARRTEAPSSSR